MSDKITIGTSLLAAIAKWAYTDTDRIVNAVAFRPDNTIVATDGHRLVMVPHPTHGLSFGVARSHLLSAIAAQDMIARDGNDPPLAHDLEATDGDSFLAYEPRAGRVADLTPTKDRVIINLGEVALRAPIVDIAEYPPISKVFTGDSTGTPDGYLLDARYLAAISEVNAASAGRCAGVRVTMWGRIDDNGRRSAVVLEGATGIRFVIMPHLDKGSRA